MTSAAASLGTEQLQSLKVALEKRQRELAAELQADSEEAAGLDRDSLAGEAPDAGDASVADVAVDTASSQRQRESDELREIRDALERMRLGTYGLCAECGGLIPFERLQANPTARYDVQHQRKLEKEAGMPTPTL